MSKIYFQTKMATLYRGDILEVLKTLPSESVHCAITSPPYFGLRQYLFENAVVLRNDISDQQRREIIRELDSLGIRPRQ